MQEQEIQQNPKDGFSLVITILIVIIVLLAGATWWYVASKKSTATSQTSSLNAGQSETRASDDTLKQEQGQVEPPKPNPESITQESMNQAPEMTIDKAKTYIATLKTSKGNVEIELNAKDTPITVNNFVTLARKGFYDNTTFHRVIKDFMIQGGDPKGDGTGGPGYQFNDEPFKGEYVRGTVAMANAGPNTNGSQFFIMHGNVALQPNYVIFGHVIKGMEVVDLIANTPVAANAGGEPSKPTEKISVTSVTIEEK